MLRRLITCVALLACAAQSFGDITVRIVTRTDAYSQIRAQNLLMRNLLAFDDLYIVDESEDFRIDLLVRDIVTEEGVVAGNTISLYLFARADWPEVGDTLLKEGTINEAERLVFDKLTAHTYFPLFFWSDYCTPYALDLSFEKVTEFINKNFFDTVRSVSTSGTRTGSEAE